MKNEYNLINFNIPNNLKRKFDSICSTIGKTRTAVIIELMDGYITRQTRLLVESSEGSTNVVSTVPEKRRLMTFIEFLRVRPDQRRTGVQNQYKSVLSTDFPAGSDRRGRA